MTQPQWMQYSHVCMYIDDDSLSLTLPKGGGRKETTKTMKCFMFKSGIISVSLTLMCCLVATNANAQGFAIKGIRACCKVPKTAIAGKITSDAIQAYDRRNSYYHTTPSIGSRPFNTPLSHKFKRKPTLSTGFSSRLIKQIESPSPLSPNIRSIRNNRFLIMPQQEAHPQQEARP